MKSLAMYFCECLFWMAHHFVSFEIRLLELHCTNAFYVGEKFPDFFSCNFAFKLDQRIAK